MPTVRFRRAHRVRSGSPQNPEGSAQGSRAPPTRGDHPSIKRAPRPGLRRQHIRVKRGVHQIGAPSRKTCATC